MIKFKSISRPVVKTPLIALEGLSLELANRFVNLKTGHRLDNRVNLFRHLEVTDVENTLKVRSTDCYGARPNDASVFSLNGVDVLKSIGKAPNRGKIDTPVGDAQLTSCSTMPPKHKTDTDRVADILKQSDRLVLKRAVLCAGNADNADESVTDRRDQPLGCAQ